MPIVSVNVNIATMPKNTTHVRVPVEIAQALTGLANGRGCSVGDLLDGFLRGSAGDAELVEAIQFAEDIRQLESAVGIVRDREEEIVEALAEAQGSRAARYTTKIHDSTVAGLDEIIEALASWSGGDNDDEEDDELSSSS